ncbi:hypothetical protein BC829DRAFT_447507 [Chytridium lagenaria]|nr:hypothetical protein BC829DRAFT_447507 [Chytridium lagenaria]
MLARIILAFLLSATMVSAQLDLNSLFASLSDWKCFTDLPGFSLSGDALTLLCANNPTQAFTVLRTCIETAKCVDSALIVPFLDVSSCALIPANPSPAAGAATTGPAPSSAAALTTTTAAARTTSTTRSAASQKEVVGWGALVALGVVAAF